ncbi:MAG: hypothetical protein U0L15_09895 [Oscillospiraceae bacterium]|jgi:hypothetical protein|nr:hypothetical protein [Oscillospiraceae bacterium]
MEKKGTILDYIGQVLLIYGGTMVVMNICTFLVGEDAQEISSLFSLGSNGMSVAVSFQFLLVAILNTALRFLFMTDAIIKKMSLTGRAVCLYGSTLAVILSFILLFGWLPAESIAWVMFAVCYVVSCTVSTLIAAHKEKTENQKLAEALKRLKEEA